LADIKNLDVLRNLIDLNLTGNPIVEEKGEDFKKEVLIALMDNLTKLQKINGDGWEAEFFAEAKAEKI
jgi:hypothetical protein